MLANRHQNAELVREHQKAQLQGEARSLSAQYGLGECTEAWRVVRLSVRKALGWIALICLAIVGIVRLASGHGPHLGTRGAEEYFVALAVVVLLVAIFTVHLPNGFSSIKLLSYDATGDHFGQPGYETDLLYLAGCCPGLTWTR